ncbi:MAG: response regulator transcription factor [Verrucomicrobia bacterium]|nr:response regulator transcription factor [Verrucomicrobiota bacterium]MDA1066763.1 response regulator transcription factor [Verrucomicrobiota bacterium]
MRILVAEDEKKIADFIKKGLEEMGHSTEVCMDGDTAYALVTTMPFDALILDIMLPGRDGLSILKNLRAQKNGVPILILTARSELNERLEGFQLGADDYLTKPFYLEELIARLHSIVRRSTGHAHSIIQAGPLLLNVVTREATYHGESIELTNREFALLEYMIQSPGRVFTRSQIYEHVWGFDFDPGTNLVDVYIRRIRGKFEDVQVGELIETVRGTGYRIKAS